MIYAAMPGVISSFSASRLLSHRQKQLERGAPLEDMEVKLSDLRQMFTQSELDLIRGVDKVFGMKIVTPCCYCGRTKQTPGHKTCDGCGGPK